MDLLEKSSILLTPTAYNNGEALCVKPSDGSGDFDFSRNSAATRVNAQGLVENVQILSGNLVQNGDFSEIGAEEVSNGSFSQQGSELVTNGSFDTDSDWTKQSGWSISNGKAECNTTTNTQLYQDNVVQTDKTYKITYTISDFVSGGVFFRFNGVDGLTRTSNGTYTEYLKAVNSPVGRVHFRASTTEGGFTGSIDNVSVREVGQDWTLGTGWSIGEDKAVYDGSSYSGISQIIPNLTGKILKVQFDIVDYTSGTIRISPSNKQSGSDIRYSNNGTYVEYYTSAQDRLDLQPQLFDGSITNISVKEVGMDWVFSGGAEITGQGARINNTITGANAYINQVNSNLTIGKSLVFQYDVVQTNGKDLAIEQIGGNISLNTSTIGNNRKVYFEFDRADANLIIKRAAAATDVTITNISVIEITDDTNLPRINYEGFSYQDALGSELITNGDFATDTGWNKGTGWSIGGGTANGLVTLDPIAQVVSGFEAGKKYKISFEVTSVTNGYIRVYAYEGASGTFTNIFSSTDLQTGIYEGVFEFGGTNKTLRFYGSLGDFTGSIDNVSVKEYLGQEVVPDSGCGHYLFESQSTNLITQSELFSDASWTKVGNTVVTPNTVISPDGTLNASTVSGLSGTGSNDLRYVKSGSTANNTYTYSVYLKGSGTVRIQLSNGIDQGFDDTITLTSNWERYSLTSTFNSTVTSNLTANLDDFNGQTATQFDIWGAQLETSNGLGTFDGSYATSYIPTSGTTVTRNQDVCNNGGSLASINSSEGVLYYEGSALVNGGSSRQVSLSDGTNDNLVQFRYDTTAGRLTSFVRGNGGAYSIKTTLTGFTQTNNNKIALVWNATNLRVWINGVEEGSVATNDLPIGMDTLKFSNPTGGNIFFGKTKALVVYKEALSNSELQELTTI